MTKIEKAKALGLSLVASAIVATTASAGMTSLDINKTYSVAVSKAAATKVGLSYLPGTANVKLTGVSTSTSNGTIKLKLTNGEFNATDYNLSTSSTCAGGSVLSSAVTVPTGTTEVFFTLNSQVTNTDLYLCSGVVGAANVDFNMTKGLAAGATTTMTTTINDGIATTEYAAKTLATVVADFTGVSSSLATSVINVNDDRKKFVTTLLATGASEMNVTKGGDTGYQATITNLKLALAGDLTGVSTITYGAAGSYTVTAADKTAGTATFTVAQSDANISNIKVNVDGTSTLSTRTLTGTLTPSTDSGTTYQSVSGNPDDLFTWTINGYQGNIPYLSSTTDTTTYIKLNNNHTVDAIVTFDATDDAGTKITNLTVNKAGATTSGLTAGQAGLWNAADILTAARASGQTGAATFASDSKFRVTATVTAPVEKVYGVAIQQISGGRDRMLPIFTSTVDNTGAATYMKN